MQSTKTRILVCLLALVLAVTGLPVSAETETVDLIGNPGFEVIDAEGAPEGWYSVGSGIKLSENAYEGSNAMLLAPRSSAALAYDVQDVQGGTKYVFSAMLLAGKSGDRPTVKITWKKKDAKGMEETVKEDSFTASAEKAEEWTKVEKEVDAPDGVTFATVCIVQGNGESTWDQVSFLGEKAVERIPGEIKEMLSNGGFEEESNGLPKGWSLIDGVKGETYEYSADAYEGKASVRFFNDPTAIILAGMANNMVGGTEYVFSGMVKSVKDNGTPTVKIAYQKPDGKGSYTTISEDSKGFAVKKGAWEKVEHTFKAPAGTTRASVLVRLVGGGECFWDAVSLMGESAAAAPVTKPAEDEKAELQGTELPETVQAAIAAGNLVDNEIGAQTEVTPPFRDSQNLFTNADFETINQKGQIDGYYWSSCASLLTEGAHSGNTALILSTDDKSANPYLQQTFRNLVGGALYQVSFWYKTSDVKNLSGYPCIKLEYYTDRSLPGARAVGEQYCRGIPKEGATAISETWNQFIFNVRLPETVREADALIRLMGTGTVHVDDVSVVMVDAPAACVLDTNWIFYYSDMEKGTASAITDSKFFPEYANATAAFTLTDGDTVLAESGKITMQDGRADWDFDLSLLSVLKKEYQMNLTMWDTEGKEIGTDSQLISKYNRPEYLTKDGRYLKNGVEEVDFMYASHPSQFQRLKDEGKLVVMQGAIALTIEQWQERLDNCLKAGVMCAPTLYYNMVPAGSPNNAMNTYEIVSTFKDHPAVFAWMVQDEPFFQLAQPHTPLYHSYRIIRGLDDKHPILIWEAATNYYHDSVKYCDMFGIDPYSPAINGRVTELVNLALPETQYEKPLYTVLEAYRPANGRFPTGNDIRNNIYQSFFAGAAGTGYYAIADADYDAAGNKIPLFDFEDAWGSIMIFAEKEHELFFEHFAKGLTPAFNQKYEEDYIYASFVKDGAVYLAVASQSAKTAEVNIPLESFDGGIKIGAYTAELIAGSDAKTFTGNGNFTISLPTIEAHLYKITPDEPVDFSGLGCSRILDTKDYPWARTQIAYLDEKDIINKATPRSFEPGRNITRGELAYSLVRALGLTSDSTETFDDVSADAFYAKEIAIGKALGILQGVGDNKFNPEAEISRQDLMVIVARGMKIAKGMADGNEADLSAFTDKTAVADYALLDIAAMVREKIVQGNADGTLNPVGNTTRAEAACILYRVMGWNSDL